MAVFWQLLRRMYVNDDVVGFERPFQGFTMIEEYFAAVGYVANFI